MLAVLIPVLLFVLIAIDAYVWSGLKLLIPGRWQTAGRIGYWTINAIVLILLISGLIIFQLKLGLFFFRVFVLAGWISMLVPKLVFVVFLLLEDVVRWPAMAVRRFFPAVTDLPVNIGRRKFVSQMGILTAAIPFGFVVHGMIRGKYQFTVHRHEIPIENLADALDGFTITQLSDFHMGSFDDFDEVARGLDIANLQRSDLLVFTGDMVNHRADEMEGWIDLVSQLEAPYGKISVVGNHDYGDYVRWPSTEARDLNFENLKTIHETVGFKLLLNQHTAVRKNGASLTVVGVENWGAPPFHQRGDLTRALDGSDPESVKVLLSHDPMHWNRVVRQADDHVHLTLSGHTHGMQFGVEIPGLKWSPVQYRYPQWAGVYVDSGRYLNVNRGFGYIGLPGRVGIWPEISVLTLRRAQPKIS